MDKRVRERKIFLTEDNEGNNRKATNMKDYF